MSYVALYRRFRPQGFSELVGQEAVRRTLEQAIVDGRVAHAYLFAGPRGTGKTSTAKIMARLLNCEHPVNGEPCGKCENCRQIADGTSMDVYEIDAASNRGIDEIRELRDTVKFAATGGQFKVYIIDEVHMLTTEAFNALLKTLEEPPERVVFILATTEAHKVPTTIKSRCQRYDFKRIPPSVIEDRLKDVAEQAGISAAPEALSIIAREADGGMRDALSLLDQCVTLCSDNFVTAESVNSSLGIVSRETVEEILTAVAEKNPVVAVTALDRMISEGKELKQLVIMLQNTLRQVMIYQAVGRAGLSDVGEEEAIGLERLSKLFRPEEFIPIIGKLHDTLGELKWTEEPRLAVESTLLTLSSTAAVSPETKIIFQPVPTAVQVQAAIVPAGDNGVMNRNINETAIPEPKKILPDRLPSATDNTEKEPAGSVIDRPLAETVRTVLDIPMKTESTPVASVAKKRETTKSASSKRTAAGGDDPSKVVLHNVQEAQGLWGSLINAVKAENNSSLFSCLSQGEPEGMTDSFIRVRFASSFVKGRTERPDFRRKIEGLLKELSGNSLSFVAVLASPGGESTKKAAGGAAKKKAPSVTAPAMLDAMKMFGEGSRVEVLSEVTAPAETTDDSAFPDDDDMPPDLENDF